MTGLQSSEVGLRPVPRKPGHAGQPLPVRDIDRRCFDVVEVAEALDVPREALHACIQAGALATFELGCRRLVTAGAVMAFVPEKKRQEVLARLDEIELRRGRHGQG